MRVRVNTHPSHLEPVPDLPDDYQPDDAPPTPPPDAGPVVFAAYIVGQTSTPAGDLTLRLGVPFDQLPHFFPLLRYMGGVMFRVTMERTIELPENGWKDTDE